MSCGLYFPSWSCAWSSSSAECPISKLKLKYPTLTHVFIAFSKPDLSYSKNSFSNTGLEFSSEFNVIRDSIKFLKSQNVLVFLSVGGGTYWSSRQFFNISATINLANDLEVDGIDIDYESLGDGTELTSHLINLRGQYAKKIFFAGWSTGAFPRDGAYSGTAIDALQKVGHLIDGVNIMAYDAGPNYSPQIAFNAYRSLYNGPLLLGFLVGQPGWGGYFLTAEDVKRDSTFISKQANSGIFIWCEAKIGTPSPYDIFSINSLFKKPPLPPVAPPNSPTVSLQCPVCKSTFIKK
jgi:hypothetical protein